MNQTIIDKRKRSYRINVSSTDQHFTRLNIYHQQWWGRQRFAGYVNLVWKSSNVLDLSDLIIEPPYRNQGLGTAVLLSIFALAQSRDVERIDGRIVGKDLRLTPHLAEWYRKYGFALEEIGPDHSMNTKSYPLSVVQQRRQAQQDPAQQRDDQTMYLITKSFTSEGG